MSVGFPCCVWCGVCLVVCGVRQEVVCGVTGHASNSVLQPCAGHTPGSFHSVDVGAVRDAHAVRQLCSCCACLLVNTCRHCLQLRQHACCSIIHSPVNQVLHCCCCDLQLGLQDSLAACSAGEEQQLLQQLLEAVVFSPCVVAHSMGQHSRASLGPAFRAICQ